ncbi:DUF975 family protein [Brotaphodocola sp.]|uniref:DUF975 family protein n=1 Tax=Brotaphodocola sp. TaxID=3073577 RepID=UPI003D7C43FE
MTRAEAKLRAKEQLGGKILGTIWLNAVIVIAIYSVLGILINALKVDQFYGLGNIISLFIMGPLSYGMYSLFLKQSEDGQPMQILDIFNGFKEDLAGNFILYVMNVILVCLWSCLFIIPGIVKYYAYSMAFLVKADHPEYGWKQCLDESKRITKGHKGELFMLDLSFIGWWILGSLLLGIGSFWVTAYYMATRTQYYKVLAAESQFQIADK